MLPFTREQFFEVFAAYNRAVFPAQVVLLVAAAVAAFALLTKRESHVAIGALLAVLWGWMAIAYHFAFFTRINPAAWIFGLAFLAAALLFAYHARKGSLRFEIAFDAEGLLALLLLFYALAGYVLVGGWAGHDYPYAPTFGAPCPTTIFTLGMLLLAKRPVPWTLFVVPLAWSAIGAFAAAELDVVQDYGLFLAGVITAVVLVVRKVGAMHPGRRVHS
jgi:hypothetical protein